MMANPYKAEMWWEENLVKNITFAKEGIVFMNLPFEVMKVSNSGNLLRLLKTISLFCLIRCKGAYDLATY